MHFIFPQRISPLIQRVQKFINNHPEVFKAPSKVINVKDLGGCTNTSLLIEVLEPRAKGCTFDKNKYFLRFPGDPDHIFIDRQFETHALNSAAALGLCQTPKIFEQDGTKLESFLDGYFESQPFTNLEHFKPMITCLHKFHYSGYELENSFNLLTRIELMCQLIFANSCHVSKEYLQLTEQIYQEILPVCKEKFTQITHDKPPTTLKPCHNDSHPGNFVFTVPATESYPEAKCLLLDWETAAMGDPMYDLAYLFNTQMDISNAHLIRDILKIYHEMSGINDADNNDLGRLLLYIAGSKIQSLLWLIVQKDIIQNQTPSFLANVERWIEELYSAYHIFTDYMNSELEQTQCDRSLKFK